MMPTNQTSAPNEQGSEAGQLVGGGDAPATRSVTLTRRDNGSYTATNAKGATLDFGRGEGEFSPVDLLLAAVAGCSAIDVDVVTSRRAEPEHFEVVATGTKVHDPNGGVRFGRMEVEFDVRFGDDPSGRQADQLVPRLIQLSHDKDCTVSRTVEHATEVEFVRRNSQDR